MEETDLLKPTLAGQGAARPIYSMSALTIAAFLGGSFAVVILATMNARLANRLPRDLPIILAGLALALLVLAGAAGVFSFPELPVEPRVLNRGLGFVYVGVFYLLYRNIYRTQTMMGIDPPKPWIPVGVAVVVSIVLTVVVAAAFVAYAQSTTL